MPYFLVKHIYTLSFLVYLLQNSFGNLKCSKGDQLTEELRKKWDGWKEQLERGQRAS
jgi:hypothetical protein